MIALSIQLEVMDKGFHRPLHFAARWRRDFAVGGLDRTIRHVGDTLMHDPQALLHLLDPHQIARVTVTGLADGDVEIHLVINIVGLRFSQIPGLARCPDTRSGEAEVMGFLRRHRSDIDGALLEDPVVGQQAFHVGDDGRKLLGPTVDIIQQAGRQILMHAAGAKIRRMKPRATGPLVKLHQIFALFKTPKQRGHRADIQSKGGDVQDMVKDA